MLRLYHKHFCHGVDVRVVFEIKVPWENSWKRTGLFGHPPPLSKMKERIKLFKICSVLDCQCKE